MGVTHFPPRTLKRVSTEMSLDVPAYDMERLIAIRALGIGLSPRGFKPTPSGLL
jgi:hypothetical protein